MKVLLSSLFGALLLFDTTSATSAVVIPPVTQPGVSGINIVCTVTDKQLSSNCRSRFPTTREVAPRISAELAYINAHPFPISGADVGAEAHVLVRLKVTPGPGGKGFEVAGSENLFLAASGPLIDDPVWAVLPNGPWASFFMPERAVRMRLSGHVAARCVAAATGALINCWVTTEEPSGQDLGSSFLKILQFARLQPLTTSGEPVAGRPIVVTMKFDLGM